MLARFASCSLRAARPGGYRLSWHVILIVMKSEKRALFHLFLIDWYQFSETRLSAKLQIIKS